MNWDSIEKLVSTYGPMALILCWVFLRGFPRVEALLRDLSKQFTDTVAHLTTSHSDDMQKQREHCDSHRDEIKQLVEKIKG